MIAAHCVIGMPNSVRVRVVPAGVALMASSVTTLMVSLKLIYVPS